VTPSQFAVLRAALGVRVAAAVVAAFRRLVSWSSADEARFAAQAVPLVRGGQRALAGLTAVHVAAQAQLVLGRPVAPPPVLAGLGGNLRAGVDGIAVYRRPLVTARVALARDEPLTRARQLGETRARQVADMDLQRAYAEASRDAMQALPAGDRPVGWRRVPTGVRSCTRCLVAAVKVWPVETLSPLHTNCNCVIEPVYDDTPPSAVEVERALRAADELTKQPGRHRNLGDVLTLLGSMTPEHGELGAVLVNPRHEFTATAELRSP
jgi:hypothetical protein